MALYATFVEPQRVSLVRIEVTLPGLPQALDGFRILHLSDLESRRRGLREEKVAELGKEAGADLVVITGDLVAKTLRGDARARATGEAARLLGEIPSKLGAWFVEGHGEQLIPSERRGFLDALDDHGVRFLQDDIAIIPVGDASLALVGIGLHPAGRETTFFQRPDGTIMDNGKGRADSYLNLVFPDDAALRDYEFAGEFRFNREGAGVGVTFYNMMPRRLDRFYRLRITEAGGVMKLSPHGTVFTRGRSTTGVSPARGEWHAFRIRAETAADGVRVRARVWRADRREPETWSVDCLDATGTRPAGGTVGVWTSGPGRKEFRGLSVVRLDGTVLVAEGRAAGSSQADWRPPDAPDYLLALAERLPPDAFPLALAHSPDIFPATAALGWPLLLAGHTQGGQVRLPFIGALTTDTVLGRRFAAGMFERSGCRLYISRGIGTSRVPLRFLSPPEVTLLTLRREARGVAGGSAPPAGGGS